MIPTSIAFCSDHEPLLAQQCVLDLRETPLHHRSAELAVLRGESLELLEARIRQAHELLRRSNEALAGKERSQNRQASYTVVRPSFPGPHWTLKRTYSQTLNKSERTVDTVTTSSSQSTVSDTTSCAGSNQRSHQQPIVTARSITTPETLTGGDSNDWGYFVDAIEEERAQHDPRAMYRHFLSTEIQRSNPRR